MPTTETHLYLASSGRVPLRLAFGLKEVALILAKTTVKKARGTAALTPSLLDHFSAMGV